MLAAGCVCSRRGGDDDDDDDDDDVNNDNEGGGHGGGPDSKLGQMRRMCHVFRLLYTCLEYSRGCGCVRGVSIDKESPDVQPMRITWFLCGH